MNSKKLLSILGMAGVVAHTAGMVAGAAHANTSPSQLEQILQNDPTSDDASAAFDILAERASKNGNGHGGGRGNGHGGNGHGNGHGSGHGGNGQGGNGHNSHGHGHGHDNGHGHHGGHGNGHGHGHYDG